MKLPFSRHLPLLSSNAGLAALAVITCAAVAVALVRDEACCANAGTVSVASSPVLAPGSPVDLAFAGCQLSCGTRSSTDRAAAKLQPGAQLGDAVFCPVSGAVFRVKAESARRDVDGKTLYFCCESCAAYFEKHQDEVLAKRAIARAGT